MCTHIRSCWNWFPGGKLSWSWQSLWSCLISQVSLSKLCNRPIV
jgi:hypothetical protein